MRETMKKFKYTYETVEAAKTAKTKDEAVEILKHNETWALKDVLKGTLCDEVKWLLPKGKVPFTPNLEQSTPSDLIRKNQDFKYFVDGPVGRQVKQFKRESIFLGILEAIHPQDAELVVDMINKVEFGGMLTSDVVNSAFPSLVSR